MMHSTRMVRPALATAGLLGLPSAEIDNVGLAALLHDIGKLTLPRAILQKTGPLTAREWEIVHRHPQIGAQMLSLAGEGWVKLGVIIASHHERWDGGGYPCGLAREAIPLEARILSVVDAYDAMTSPRVYSRPLAPPEARNELRRCAGHQFDPSVVAAFLQVVDRRERMSEIVF